MTGAADEVSAPSRRRRWAWASVAVVAAVAATSTGLVFLGSASDAEAGSAGGAAAQGETTTTTAEVTLGDLTGVTPKGGTLSLLEGPAITAGIDGTITELPAPGTQLASRSVLHRVDDTPVMAVEGPLPQWRSFEVGMSDGPDIGQLERSLVAWGHLGGAANDHFDARTASAVRAWQKELGLPRSGVLEKGRIQFVTGTFTVADVSAAVGGAAGGGAPLYTTTRAEPVVTVDLPVGSSLARLDGVVTVDLPTGGSAPGRVTGVGAPRANDAGATVVAVTVSLDDPAAVGDLSNASVQVGFVSEVRQGVLSVPVTALGAASGGGFVVEVVEGASPGAGETNGDASTGADPGSRLVPVETGLFAGDRVEITGDVSEGDQVVVPA